jgi:hypothetical protein
MANTKLTKTFSSDGNRQKYTISLWVKRGTLGNQFLINTDGGNEETYLRFKGEDNLQWFEQNSSAATQANRSTNQLFRDVHGWYHIVIARDSTLGTANDRLKLYVNGTLNTSWSENTTPAQDTNTRWNKNVEHMIGVGGSGSSNYFDGSMSHIHFCDGYTYAASDFGETDATTGEWKIKTSPSVSYGTNGFFIFKDSQSITDQSGEGNNFTVGAGTLTKTEDNPSNVFATFNPLIGRHSNGNYLQPDWSNGNLTGTAHGSAWRVLKSTLSASSGKYYAEFKWVSDSNTRYSYVGVYNEDDYANKATGYPYLGDMLDAHCYYSENGNYYTNGGSTSFGNTFSSSGDGIVGVAMDLDNSKIYFSSNGSWQGSGNPSNGTGGKSLTANKTYTFAVLLYSVGSIVYSANFGNGYFGTTAVSSAGTNASGNGIFEYDVPTGYTALSTKGLNL